MIACSALISHMGRSRLIQGVRFSEVLFERLDKHLVERATRAYFRSSEYGAIFDFAWSWLQWNLDILLNCWHTLLVCCLVLTTSTQLLPDLLHELGIEDGGLWSLCLFQVNCTGA